MAQIVMGAVGAVAGFFIGGPTGAMIGFNIGASLGASMEDVSVQGNKIGDIAAQTSKEGVVRPIVWGRVRPIGGNLIATSAPDIVKTKHKSGGKGGGGGTTTTTESVYRTYAIRVCEGPITGFVRIWRNNELVYDARGNAWGNENNPAFLGVATLYLGGWDQMPDPSLEGIFGSGNVPPHRGTAYIVMNHELLDDTGGAVPQWIFEVERSEGVTFTSTLYNVECIEEINQEGISNLKESTNISKIDALSQSQLSIQSGLLKNTLIQYQNWTPDALSQSQLSIQSGLLKNTLIQYQNLTPDALSQSQLSIQSGLLKNTLIQYQNWTPDALSQSQLSIQSGSLS